MVEQGPVSTLLGTSDATVVERARAALFEELTSRHDGDGLRLGYAVWIITATR